MRGERQKLETLILALPPHCISSKFRAHVCICRPTIAITKIRDYLQSIFCAVQPLNKRVDGLGGYSQEWIALGASEAHAAGSEHLKHPSRKLSLRARILICPWTPFSWGGGGGFPEYLGGGV